MQKDNKIKWRNCLFLSLTFCWCTFHQRKDCLISLPCPLKTASWNWSGKTVKIHVHIGLKRLCHQGRPNAYKLLPFVVHFENMTMGIVACSSHRVERNRYKREVASSLLGSFVCIISWDIGYRLYLTISRYTTKCSIWIAVGSLCRMLLWLI